MQFPTGKLTRVCCACLVKCLVSASCFMIWSSIANFERTMRSVIEVHRCGLSNLQACIVGIILLVCLNAGVVEGPEIGSCGDLNGGFICDQGNCCSKNNFCGSDLAFCGEDCQTKYSPIGGCEGDTRSGPASPPGSTTPMCGKSAGNKKCADNYCCSKDGFCGTTASYCSSPEGCQSQCKLTPGEIAGVVLGALGGFAICCAIAFGIFKLHRRIQRNMPINRENIIPVRRLFPVNAAEDKNTCVDIVFCHGLAIGDLEREVWKNTWQRRRSSDDEPVDCWPEVWLGSDLKGKARVFALEYDANVSSDPRRKNSHTDVSDIAKNLLQSLFGAKVDIGQSNAVVLIGHSFGGLVIKSLVVEAQSIARHNATNQIGRAHAANCQRFVENIRGFIFYAVPHSGARNLSKYIKALKGLLGWHRMRRGAQDQFHSPPGTLLANIDDLSRKMEDLSVQFADLLKIKETSDDDLPVFAFIEGQPMNQDVGKIVEDASAMRLSKRNCYKVEAANHFTVCQPCTRDEESYQILLSVLTRIVDALPSSSHRTTVQLNDVEMNQISSEHSTDSHSLLHPGKIPLVPQKLTRLIRSKPTNDTLPLYN